MSDRELVSINSEQFAKLETAFGNIATTLEGKLAHIERTLFDGFKALPQGSGSGDNSQVLTAIKVLGDKVDALALAIKEGSSAEVQEAIDKSTQELQSSTSALDTAVKANKPK